MDINITARHFKAHETLRGYAEDAVAKLEKYHRGIANADMVLSYEKAVNSVKIAELHVTVGGTVLTSVAKTDAFEKSIDTVVEKVTTRLTKFKAKQREKKKAVIRRTRSKV